MKKIELSSHSIYETISAETLKTLRIIPLQELMMKEGQQLKNVGLKITIPRIKILQILEQSAEHHLSAEDIYKIVLDSGEDVGLATVYRVLAQFESVGLIKKHNFEGGYSVFELNQADHHDHLVCLNCGQVVEFVDEIIEKRQSIIAKNAGFVMLNHSLNIYGTCPKCI